MAIPYSKPAVQVIQEFIGLVPALAEFTLPGVAIGPAFQLVDDDLLGTYVGTAQSYPYASLMPGAIPDIAPLDPAELFPSTKKPIVARIRNAVVQIVVPQTDGIGAGQVLTGDSGIFSAAAVGDLVVITPQLAVSIVAAQTDGSSVATAGLKNRLTAGTPGQFVNVKVGDTVVVTAGTNAVTGTFTVMAKSGDTLLLDADVNDGVGASVDTAYSITGDRGVANAGTYKVKQVTDAQDVLLESPLVESEAPIAYSVNRKISTDITLVLTAQYTPSLANIAIPSGLVYTINAIDYPIIGGDVRADYRGLRTDLADRPREYTSPDDITAVFGQNQIKPANILAYALSLMLQNTTTGVYGLGMDANILTDEVLSHENAIAVLAGTDMYCLAPQSQNSALHPMYRAHVLDMSNKALERVVVTNRGLVTIETLVDESTTVLTQSGSRIIVNTQIDGQALVAQNTKLKDLTADQFMNVQPGDSVVIFGGTNAILGTFTVVSKQDSNNLTLSGAIVTANSTDLQYYILRGDGLGADGVTFYDRNASFITDLVSPGHMLHIMSGPLAGRYVIGSVPSEKELVLATQIPGVVTLKTAVDYLIDRDMTRSEQAQFLGDYSASIGSRRVVNTWSDDLEAPVGQEILDVPGFFAGAVVAAITAGLPPQRGFTRLSVSGFLGIKHSNGYFTDDQLNTIAAGGTMIFTQPGAQQPLVIRHQLTTDRSAIKFQEYSITKNADYISKYLRNGYDQYIGKWNIIDPLKDEIKKHSKADTIFLRDTTKLPEIGGVVKDMKLVSLEESTTQIDQVLMTVSADLPIPLNGLIITLQM